MFFFDVCKNAKNTFICRVTFFPWSIVYRGFFLSPIFCYIKSHFLKPAESLAIRTITFPSSWCNVIIVFNVHRSRTQATIVRFSICKCHARFFNVLSWCLNWTFHNLDDFSFLVIYSININENVATWVF